MLYRSSREDIYQFRGLPRPTCAEALQTNPQACDTYWLVPTKAHVAKFAASKKMQKLLEFVASTKLNAERPVTSRIN
jgi:hypothetical protein